LFENDINPLCLEETLKVVDENSTTDIIEMSSLVSALRLFPQGFKGG